MMLPIIQTGSEALLRLLCVTTPFQPAGTSNQALSSSCTFLPACMYKQLSLEFKLWVLMQAVRGKKTKAAKAKAKYGNQDEEDRQLAMEFLASAGLCSASNALPKAIAFICNSLVYCQIVIKCDVNSGGVPDGHCPSFASTENLTTKLIIKQL